MKNHLAKVLLGVGVAVAAVWPAAAQTKLNIYTSLENDQLQPYKSAIEAAVPGVEVVWTRDSTGVITARFLAEKDNPRADMIVGHAATAILYFKKLGLLEPYKAAGADKLKEVFRDNTPNPSWVGQDAYLGVICFNTAEAGKDKIAAPTSWKDLIKPEYKDKIVMPNPASSGTGYLMVAGWLQMMGETEGWKFLDALHENIASYLHSGSAPCVQAAKGERVAGIALDMRGASEKTKGAPLDVIIPKEGTGWEMEASAIVKGTKNLELAKKVMDWVATKGANELYSKSYAVVAMPGVENFPPNYPKDAEKGMIKNDLTWMAENRDRILAEWSKRYDGKSAPKK
ncbi:MAG TPA: putative 2-aminoethylphosphonate ABC transporter substrate-binding protein [Pseudorhodoplanes sp.]|jgi:iron(III) transport system substrate-binding protein|nr:putative 2-aminoethylphosphonate ABC transporter substrate-binding protein [Pseudorhodoplanes sp.]